MTALVQPAASECRRRDVIEDQPPALRVYVAHRPIINQETRCALQSEGRSVPRFHFNVYDGISTHDRDGVELADLSAARHRALSHAADLLDEEEQRGRLGEDWRMEVTDENGRLLFRLDFIVEGC